METETDLEKAYGDLLGITSELVAVLHEITERYDRLDRKVVAGQHSEPNGTVARARAVLAKATGESP